MNAKTLIAGTLCVVLVVGSGCSLFVPPTQWLTIKTDNPAASIYVDGRLVGKGSVDAELLRRYGHAVTVEVDGKIVATRHIGIHISPTGVVDLIGGFFLLFPWLGILGPGFWDLDPLYLEIVTESPPMDVRP